MLLRHADEEAQRVFMVGFFAMGFFVLILVRQ